MKGLIYVLLATESLAASIFFNNDLTPDPEQKERNGKWIFMKRDSKNSIVDDSINEKGSSRGGSSSGGSSGGKGGSSGSSGGKGGSTGSSGSNGSGSSGGGSSGSSGSGNSGGSSSGSSSNGSSGGKGGTSSSDSGSSSGSGGSGGKGGSTSGSSSGSSSDGGKGGSSGSSTKGGSPKADSSVRGYGNSRLPSYAESQAPPPPYSAGKSAPPSPNHASTSYGQTGPRGNYWNGQYYPYHRFGYGSSLFPFLPLGIAPLFFVGPFGFYGHYGSLSNGGNDNATVSGIYTNGTDIGNNTLVNGTYYTLSWDSGKYNVETEQYGSYSDGVSVGNDTFVNGTFTPSPQSVKNSNVVNPNFTSNGTMLPSDQTSSTNTANGVAPAMILVGVALLL